MRNLQRLAVAVAVASCARQVPLSAGRLAEVKRLAIVARVERGPSAAVARSEPGGLALFPNETDASKVAQRIATALSKKISRFQISERVRADLLRLLPPGPPWSRQVA